MFADHPAARMFFIVTTVIAVIYMAALIWRLPGVPRRRRLHRRLRLRWPTFNVADMCLVVGLGMFVIDLARLSRTETSATTQPDA
jgi:lipoprotein signal peptidase